MTKRSIMKIEHNKKQKTFHFIPENELDAFLLGRLHERLNEKKLKYVVSYEEGSYSNIQYAELNETDLLQYLLK